MITLGAQQGICFLRVSLQSFSHYYKLKALVWEASTEAFNFVDFVVLRLEGRNACQLNNGGCSQLCLPTSENTRSCACTVGYNLRADRLSCEGMHMVTVIEQY